MDKLLVLLCMLTAFIVGLSIWVVQLQSRLYDVVKYFKLEGKGTFTVDLHGSTRQVTFDAYGYVKDEKTGIECHGVSAGYDFPCHAKSKVKSLQKLEERLLIHAIDTAPKVAEIAGYQSVVDITAADGLLSTGRE